MWEAEKKICILYVFFSVFDQKKPPKTITNHNINRKQTNKKTNKQKHENYK